jgi:hypothetical protein
MLKCSVLFEVRTEFLNNIETSFGFKGLSGLPGIDGFVDIDSFYNISDMAA